jgi:minor histocompatibility antigen H13
MDDQTATITAANSTVKFKPTPEGMACAYCSLMVMALVPIFVGSFKSIKHHIDTRAKCQETGEQAETMTDKDAAMFPLIASVALFSFYILIKINPDLVNLALSGYFFMLGVIAIFRLLAPATRRIFPTKYNLIQYAFLFGSKNLNDKNDTSEESRSGSTSPTESQSSTEGDIAPADVIFDCKFTPSDILASILAGALGVWYLWTKHWVANNAFGLAFALNGIELLPVNTMKIGCILLCGLFFYDVFWVFGTDVMVSVAKKFDAPIKILFPQDFLVSGFWGKNFAMLGLGDIVIPGIFIAFLLRFDRSLNRKSNTYFWSCFLAYIFGLGLTIGVMSYFKHAQPALLYLVPCCILVPLSVSVVKGDLGALLKYRDHPLPPQEVENSQDAQEKESDVESVQEEEEQESRRSVRKNSRKNK